MDRSLAHVEVVHNVRPIEGCDNICQCNILGWNLIVKKDEAVEGAKMVYVEIDSLLPSDNEVFAFLEKKKFRIKTMKMKGVISQGIAFPLSILPKGKYEVGDDVTRLLKITKIPDETTEPIQNKNSLKRSDSKFLKTKFAKWLLKFKFTRWLLIKLFVKKTRAHNFPVFVVKSDEERIQNRPWVLEKYRGVKLISTEKLDGTSTTFSLEKVKKGFDFAVCSRNRRLLDEDQKNYYDKNYWWDMAFKYSAEDVLIDLFKKLDVKHFIYLQGETIGPGIQSNKYKLAETQFRGYTLVVDGKKINSIEAEKLLAGYSIPWVPILDTEFVLPKTVAELLKYADAKSVLVETPREGVVIRDTDNTVSFKVISNAFLLKYDI